MYIVILINDNTESQYYVGIYSTIDKAYELADMKYCDSNGTLKEKMSNMKSGEFLHTEDITGVEGLIDVVNECYLIIKGELDV